MEDLPGGLFRLFSTGRDWNMEVRLPFPDTGCLLCQNRKGL